MLIPMTRLTSLVIILNNNPNINELTSIRDQIGLLTDITHIDI